MGETISLGTRRCNQIFSEVKGKRAKVILMISCWRVVTRNTAVCPDVQVQPGPSGTAFQHHTRRRYEFVSIIS